KKLYIKKGDFIMMDEMKLNLGSKFMRKIVSKILVKQIQKKTGYKININLEELMVNFEDGDTTIRTHVELKMDSIEFTKLMKGVEKDIDEMV
ncbi:hypothetical protein RZS08_00210, partial [Arthrospira platensis SPKY1]|nr:hypothetical protein [Arthrospira platensis SPKY1]